MGKESERTIAAVEAALQLLDVFKGGDALRIADLHAKTGLTRSRITRLLGTLEACGYVVTSDKNLYLLGPKIFRLGWTMREAYTPMLGVIRPALDRLVNNTGGTAFFSIPRGNQRVVLAKCEPTSGIRFVIEEGEARNLYVGATGRVLLSQMSPEIIDNILSDEHLDPITPSTIINSAQLREAISKARNERFAVSFGEATSTAFAMAIPVISKTGLVGALSLAGPLNEYEGNKTICRNALETEADFLSTRLA